MAMSFFLWTLLTKFFKALFSLRYRIHLKGMENLKHLDPQKGTLFLPNHPAYLDPIFNYLIFWPKFRMRPLVIEYVFDFLFLKPFLKLVRALLIPNFENGVNEYKLKKAEEAIREISQGLSEKEAFMVYPSGRLKLTGKEQIGGASGVYDLLQKHPEVNIVLLRTTGFWGSSFSRALRGKVPSLTKTVLQGVWILLKNFIFFTPRREIFIEIEVNPKAMPSFQSSKLEINRFLENWYNRYPDDKGKMREIEPLSLVSYSFWKKDLPKVEHPLLQEKKGKSFEIDSKIQEKVYQGIRDILEKQDLAISPEMHLVFDLGMDSLNVAELIAFVAKNFDIPELRPEDLETVETVLEVAAGQRKPIFSEEPVKTYTWKEETARPLPDLPFGKTIPEAFLHSCQRMRGFLACADDLVGPMSYNRLQKVVLVLAQEFRHFQEERIALMLPSTLSAYAVILALQFAGKTPVMLNWTLGPRYLEEMMKISQAKRILTSKKFLDRLSNAQFGECIDRFVFLEDLRKKISLLTKLKALCLSYSSISCVLRFFGLHKVDEHAASVILFTSGTEASPKGVPLSHKNILSNQRSALQCVELYADDVVYGILPPFHSFGFSVAGLFPLLGGVKVAFYPNPTDSFALAEGVKRWQITLFCSAPAFIKGLLRVAKKEDLASIRFFVSGAEKAPQELFQKVKELGGKARLLEGYGITECSPFLSLNRANLPHKGVGRLAPDVEMITIHPETLKELPEGSEGEICVRGPNVFYGYLDSSKDPFIEIRNQKWYRTGDIGYLDKDGSLILSGRIKRFTKLGGEMISLGAVEEVITKELISNKKISPDIPSIALIADEKEIGKSFLILFTTVPLEKEEVNEILSSSGFSNLVKIAEVKKIHEIPLMGAGKTDYRNLQGLC